MRRIVTKKEHFLLLWVGLSLLSLSGCATVKTMPSLYFMTAQKSSVAHDSTCAHFQVKKIAFQKNLEPYPQNIRSLIYPSALSQT